MRQKLHRLNNNGSRPTTGSSLRNRSRHPKKSPSRRRNRRNRSLCSHIHRHHDIHRIHRHHDIRHRHIHHHDRSRRSRALRA
jgi:hypothetical protein